MVILSAAVGVYGYVSLTNHYLFRTYALDLGMFNHTLFQISQLQIPQFTLGIDGLVVPYLADHFSPIVFLLTPFYVVLGDSALLWIQVSSIALFTVYLYKTARHFGINGYISTLLTLLPLVCWALLASLSFDFHTNVLAAMMVLPMIYSILRQNILGFLLWFTLILLCKENMSLWLVFLLTGMCFAFKSDLNKRFVRLLLWLSLFSLIYFITVTTWIMPSLHPSGTNIQLNKYVGADGGLSGVIIHCLSDPLAALQLVYRSPDGELSADKINFLILLLGSGGLLWFSHSVLLWMMIPILAQKFLSLNGGFWGIEAQYSIEIVPIIGFGLILFIRHFHWKLALVFILLSSTLSAILSENVYIRKHPNAAFYMPRFARSPYKINDLNAMLEKIPEGETVSTVSIFAPKLEKRMTLYHYPIVEDANYIALLKGNGSTYPMKTAKYEQALQNLHSDSTWLVWQSCEEALIFKRQQP